MDKQLTARRLAAALGRKVTPDDIDFEIGGHIRLKSGETVSLLAGNAAYLGDGRYTRNGKAWNPDTDGGSPRWE